MEKTENKGLGRQIDTNHDRSLHDTQEIISSITSRFHQKPLLFHSIPLSHLSKNLKFQSLIVTGNLNSENGGNHVNTLSSREKEMRELEGTANIRRRAVQACLGFRKSVYKRKQCYYILSQYYSKRSDLRLKQMNVSKDFDIYNTLKFRNRRLLSGSLKKRRNLENVPKSRKRKQKSQTESVSKRTNSRTNIIQRTGPLPPSLSSNVSNTSEVNLEKLALQELKEYKEFVSMMEQTFSKDPLRAMLSVSFLLIVLMLAVKLCGMKPMKQERENLDFHENVHYVNIHDILKRKRPYLPKYLLAWERRLRRKFKRRQRMRVREQEQADIVISDNSEEEMLIYGGNCDF